MAEDVRAEMVSTVYQVVVSAGDEVKEGDTLVILESMKMEIPVIAEEPGTVTSVDVKVGDDVGAAVLQAERHSRRVLDVDGLRGGDRPRLRAHEAPCGARAVLGTGTTLAEPGDVRIGDPPDSAPGPRVWDHGTRPLVHPS